LCSPLTLNVPCAWREARGMGPGCRTIPAAIQRRKPVRQALIDDLRTDEVEVRIDSTRRNDLAFRREHFGAGADLHPFGHAFHHVGIAGLADADNATIPDADIRLHYPPAIDDDRIRDHEVERALRAGG